MPNSLVQFMSQALGQSSANLPCRHCESPFGYIQRFGLRPQPSPIPPSVSCERTLHPAFAAKPCLLSLPDDVLANVVGHLDSANTARLRSCSQRCKLLVDKRAQRAELFVQCQEPGPQPGSFWDSLRRYVLQNNERAVPAGRSWQGLLAGVPARYLSSFHALEDLTLHTHILTQNGGGSINTLGSVLSAVLAQLSSRCNALAAHLALTSAPCCSPHFAPLPSYLHGVQAFTLHGRFQTLKSSHLALIAAAMPKLRSLRLCELVPNLEPNTGGSETTTNTATPAATTDLPSTASSSRSSHSTALAPHQGSFLGPIGALTQLTALEFTGWHRRASMSLKVLTCLTGLQRLSIGSIVWAEPGYASMHAIAALASLTSLECSPVPLRHDPAVDLHLVTLQPASSTTGHLHGSNAGSSSGGSHLDRLNGGPDTSLELGSFRDPEEYNPYNLQLPSLAALPLVRIVLQDTLHHSVLPFVRALLSGRTHGSFTSSASGPHLQSNLLQDALQQQLPSDSTVLQHLEVHADMVTWPVEAVQSSSARILCAAVTHLITTRFVDCAVDPLTPQSLEAPDSSPQPTAITPIPICCQHAFGSHAFPRLASLALSCQPRLLVAVLVGIHTLQPALLPGLQRLEVQLQGEDLLPAMTTASCSQPAAAASRLLNTLASLLCAPASVSLSLDLSQLRPAARGAQLQALASSLMHLGASVPQLHVLRIKTRREESGSGEVLPLLHAVGRMQGLRELRLHTAAIANTRPFPCASDLSSLRLPPSLQVLSLWTPWRDGCCRDSRTGGPRGLSDGDMHAWLAALAAAVATQAATTKETAFTTTQGAQEGASSAQAGGSSSRQMEPHRISRTVGAAAAPLAAATAFAQRPRARLHVPGLRSHEAQMLACMVRQQLHHASYQLTARTSSGYGDCDHLGDGSVAALGNAPATSYDAGGAGYDVDALDASVGGCGCDLLSHAEGMSMSLPEQLVQMSVEVGYE